MRLPPVLAALVLLATACGEARPDDPDAGTPAAAPDAGPKTPENKALHCVGAFGDTLTAAFGRVDATVVAIVKPTDAQCPGKNDDHVVVEVSMNGAVYRMIVNVQSSFGDPNVLFAEVDHALPGDAWSEGWHPGVTLDYVTGLGLHGNDPAFVSHPLAELAGLIADAIPLNEKISIYGESGGGTYSDSLHKIHRTGYSHDGAIVLGATGPHPRMLLFHFANQTF
jgi:hypothetical protein